jgi:hypothetical protein
VQEGEGTSSVDIQLLKTLSQCLAMLERLICNKSNTLGDISENNIYYSLASYLSELSEST